MITIENIFFSRGLFLSYLKLFLGIVFYFCLTPFILHQLGKFTYGIWIVLDSIIGYFLIFDFGMNVAVAKYTAEYRSTNQLEKLNELISGISASFLVLSSIFVVFCSFLLPLLPKIFHVPPELIFMARVSLFLMVINVGLMLWGGMLGNIIYGCQRIDIWRTFGIAQVLVNASLVIVFLYMGLGLIGLAVASLFSNIILLILYSQFLNQNKYGIVIRPQLSKIRALQNVAPYSLRSFILGLTSRILYQTDTIVIGIFLAANYVTPYAIAYQFCFYATYFFSEISTMLFPRFAKLYSTSEIKNLGTLYLQTAKVSVAIMTPLVIFLVMWGSEFIKVWVGANNFVGQNVFTIFLMMFVIHSIGTPAGLLLQSIGKNKWFTYSEVANALLNLLLSVILVQKIGVFGVALGTLIAHLCTSSWFVPFLACKHLNLSLRQYIIKSILPPLASGIPVMLIAQIFIQRLFPDTLLVYLALKGFLVVFFYAGIYFVFFTEKNERKIYLSLFSIKI